ncbi:hypothetical protein S245_063240, partial [Arachis hypogaea]
GFAYALQGIYDKENALNIRMLKGFDDGDIDVTTDKIGAALGLPSIGKSFSEEEEWTSEQERLVAPFKSMKTPTSNHVTSPKYLRAIVDVENITRYNWTRFMHDELMEGGIVTYLVKQDLKKKKMTTKCQRKKTTSQMRKKDKR